MRNIHICSCTCTYKGEFCWNRPSSRNVPLCNVRSCDSMFVRMDIDSDECSSCTFPPVRSRSLYTPRVRVFSFFTFLFFCFTAQRSTTTTITMAGSGAANPRTVLQCTALLSHLVWRDSLDRYSILHLVWGGLLEVRLQCSQCCRLGDANQMAIHSARCSAPLPPSRFLSSFSLLQYIATVTGPASRCIV